MVVKIIEFKFVISFAMGGTVYGCLGRRKRSVKRGEEWVPLSSVPSFFSLIDRVASKANWPYLLRIMVSIPDTQWKVFAFCSIEVEIVFFSATQHKKWILCPEVVTCDVTNSHITWKISDRLVVLKFICWCYSSSYSYVCPTRCLCTLGVQLCTAKLSGHWYHSTW